MFFSVKYSVKIAGKVYTPCVCYALPDVLITTVEKMVKEGRAYTYDHRVAFQNGKVIEKKGITVIKNVPVTKAVPVAEEAHVEKPKKNKKDKKEEILVQKEAPVVEELVPSPEEVADNPEEF